MEKLKKVVYSILEWLCIAVLGVMTATVLLSVVGRAFFKWMPAWNEELSILCLTWISLLGAAIAEFNGTHISITVLELMLPGRIYKWIQLFFYLIKLIICGVFLYFGVLQVRMTLQSTMVSMPLSQAWRFLSGLVFAACASVAVLYNARRVIKGDVKHD